jgi:glucose-6-phosphate 1-dehydrogenase
MGHEEVMAAWAWTDDLLSAWQENDQKLEHYAAGTDGPLQANLLLDRDGRAWWDDNNEAGA